MSQLNREALFTRATLTDQQKYAVEVARVGFMSACPFYAHYFYAEMEEVFTEGVPMAATDGRHIFINPKYIAGLKPAERVFVYAHEVDHAISRHPQRSKTYAREGKVRDLTFDHNQMNIAMDYVINAGLIECGVGMMNPEWLFDPATKSSDLAEDVYERHFEEPPTDQGGGTGQGSGQGKTYANSGKAQKGLKGDPNAAANGGGFDDVLEPSVDPVTGREDLPSDAEFKEAVARAASAAKAMGKLPGGLQRKVDEILEPQVDWRDHIRQLFTGHVGARKESWDNLNRRYAALGALSSHAVPQFPGRRGHGADTVGVVVDNSGSIGEKELSAFFGEVAGILADVRPKRVILVWCDAQVQQVDEARNFDELTDVRVKGSPGGGGTDFRPPFDYFAREDIHPETVVYITDMYGSFPAKPPGYPVIWCASTDVEAPWGEVVRIKI